MQAASRLAPSHAPYVIARKPQDSHADGATVWQRIKRAVNTVWKGAILTMPVSPDGEVKHDYAHRWPAPAIIGMVVAIASAVITPVLTISLTFFLLYDGNAKETSTQREQLIERVTKAEGETNITKRDIAELQRTVERLDSDKRDLTRRVEKAEGIIGLGLNKP